MPAKVYFSRTITPEKVLELYKELGIELSGKVAVKVHSGEKGNQNFLRPDFWKPIVDYVITLKSEVERDILFKYHKYKCKRNAYLGKFKLYYP